MGSGASEWHSFQSMRGHTHGVGAHAACADCAANQGQLSQNSNN